jgi:hypothetical protein
MKGVRGLMRVRCPLHLLFITGKPGKCPNMSYYNELIRYSWLIGNQDLKDLSRKTLEIFL